MEIMCFAIGANQFVNSVDVSILQDSSHAHEQMLPTRHSRQRDLWQREDIRNPGAKTRVAHIRNKSSLKNLGRVSAQTTTVGHVHREEQFPMKCL